MGRKRGRRGSDECRGRRGVSRCRGGLLCVVVAVAASQMLGCAGGGGAVESEADRGVERRLGVRFEAQRYAGAFDAARVELVARGYRLARVDGALGVIETEPKPTPGYLHPLDGDRGSLGDVVEDTVNAHRRRVRVVFERLGGTARSRVGAPGAPVMVPDDLTRADGGVIEMRVEVAVERRHTPGRRLETESIRRSGGWRDPSHGPRAMLPVYHEVIGRDEWLEDRLGDRIADRAGLIPRG